MLPNGRLGIGIIGCGGIAGSHAWAYRLYPDDCDIVAVSDVSEAAARRLMERYEVTQWHPAWGDLLADDRVDVVSICTPHFLHAPQTIAAAAAGKHVICEKPMAMTAGEGHEMVEACRAAGVRLSIGSERFNPRIRFIRDRVLPELGRVRASWLADAYFRDSAYYARASWRGTWAQEGGGVCANQAIYTWDQWQWLLGGVDTAYGYWANVMHPSIEVEDVAFGLARFRNGTCGKLLATSCCEWRPGVCGLRIMAENGSVHADDPWLYDMDFTLAEAPRDAALHAEFEREIDPEYVGRFHHWQVRDMLSAVREDRETLVPEAIDALKILNGIHWHGWNHADRFRAWAQTFDPPVTAEEGRELGWTGGTLLKGLERIVKTPGARLEAPFLC